MKKIYTRQNKQRKRCFATLIIKKWKLKPQLVFSIPIIDWLKFKKLTILHVGKNVEQLEPSHNADESVKLYHFVKNSWAISWIVKHTPTI